MSYPAKNVRAKIPGVYVLLVAANAAAWAAACLLFLPGHALLMGPAFLAYSLGLRHAMDADHIAAIDNVTRALVQDRKYPLTVGLFFSLGHSTIVFALTAALAVSAAGFARILPQLHSTGSVIGAAVSSLFLFAIASINIVVLASVIRASVRARREPNRPIAQDELNRLGIWTRLLHPLLARVSASWHMYPIGALFGLGFDTATEVGVLGIAAMEAGRGLPMWEIMVFPALFTAGMALVDTTDGIVMLGVYGWAFVDPIKRLAYNVAITLGSVLAALFVGAVQGLGVLVNRYDLGGSFWNAIAQLNGNAGIAGAIIVAIFVASYVVSVGIYGRARFDERSHASGIETPSARSHA